MFKLNELEALRKLFKEHNYVMTTAELTKSKLYYADIQKMLGWRVD